MLLSHYTSRAGLKGIASDKCIRATKFTQLNDKREIEYGYIQFVGRALRAVFEKLDNIFPRKSGAVLDLAEAEAKLTEHFRSSFNEPNGSEPLYVASFAKGTTQDHEDRGILTLWDRYTHCEGYCLQFAPVDVKKVIASEALSRNYGLLSSDDVQYGIDEESGDFRELLFQIKQLLKIEVARAFPGPAMLPDYDAMWPFPLFATRMLRYIAKHKDPFFEDERETRIIAVPGRQARAESFLGLVSVKLPKAHSDGRQYIAIGENIHPGLEPQRIIVGPRADKNIEDVMALFERKPTVIIADFPV